MKTSSVVIALSAAGAVILQAAQTSTVAPGQVATPAPTAYTVVDRGANHKVWQYETYKQMPNGQVVTNLHQYTELATGMHYWSNGQWLDSQEVISILPDGTAAATNGQHQVYFPADIYQGVITLKTPDAATLQSRPLGLCYDDGTNTVMIAELTNSIGELAGANQAIYSRAFSGLVADMRYTYTKAGFEQDVILCQRPPDPQSLGLNPDTTKLELLTEFFNPPSPRVASQTLPAQAGLALDDESLDFGIMKIVPGQAFLVGQNTIQTQVAKHWLTVDGRTFLMEEIPVMAVADQLATLPLTASANGGAGHFQYLATSRLRLPAQRLAAAAASGRFIRLAKATGAANGLVLDYQTVNSSVTNFTFQGDTTYYINGTVNTYGATFEGGTVLKYAAGSKLDIYNTNNSWLATSYRPVVLTAKDDNTVGDTISGSTGTPSWYYANWAFSLQQIQSPTFNVSNFRVAYANAAILSPSLSTNTYANGQLINCNYGMVRGYKTYLRNILFSHVINSLGVAGIIYDVQNATFDSCSNAIAIISPGGTLFFTNCIFANVTNIAPASGAAAYGSYNGFYNCGGTNFGTAITSISSNPFQVAGAGSYYLTNGCSFHNAGTTNIDPVLLASLGSKTTYPPIVYSNVTFSVATNFSIQASRDTNSSPDLGYHYDPLDYIFENCTANANVTFNVGTAAAWLAPSYGNYGIFCASNAFVTFNGTATSPDQWVALDTVQEAAGESSASGISCSITNPLLQADFTHFSGLAGVESPIGFNYGQVNLTNCELYNTYGVVQTEPEDLSFANCLAFRPNWTGLVLGVPTTNVFSLQNCTIYGGNLSLLGAIYLSVSNCAFNGTAIGLGVEFTNCDYNAFLQGSNRLPVIGPHDVIVTNSYNWQSSWFGNYYQPTNSPLINAGSTTADQMGLYYFTTQTNQVPETNSTVDIGYHYAATDASGNPLDSNIDGIPDWWILEYFGNLTETATNLDANGNTLLYDYTNNLVPVLFQFYGISVTNNYVNTLTPLVQLQVTGNPYYIATLVDDTNFNDAVWNTYSSSNVTVNLGFTQGWHDVWIGLHGHGDSPANAVWQYKHLNLDYTPPALFITSPTNGTVNIPTIQLTGFSPEALSSISYDLTNATGLVTNQQILITDQFYDVNQTEFTTNSFHGYDIPLTNGVNTFTLHATDLAGNVTTLVTNITLDYSSKTNPPNVQISWPANGDNLSGNSFNLGGQVSDPTASVSAQLDGTNTPVNSAVGRDGTFWIQNLPLHSGTNTVSLTVQDVVGNTTTTNLTLIQSPVVLTINPVVAGQVTVTGSISQSGYTVWVNNVQATLSGTNWTVQIPPITLGGGSVSAIAVPNGGGQ